MRRRFRSAARRAPIAVALAVLCAACASTGIESSSERGAALPSTATYTWSDGAAPTDLDGDLEVDPELLRSIRRAVDAELAARGVRAVDPGVAKLHIGLSVAVTQEIRHHDPYYARYTYERFENGTVALRLERVADAALVWRGAGSLRLRTAARGTGAMHVTFTPTDEARDWRIAELVPAVFDGFPEPGSR